MADETTGKNGATGAPKGPDETPTPIQAKIVSQYLKDISFENPNVSKLITGSGDQPNLEVEVNVNAHRISGDLYESAIELKATAANNIGTIYILEAVYAGVLKVEKIPEQALQPFLLISGPTMVFPFLRRLVADITREGGYPPLLLDPIDFAALYFRRQKEAPGAAKADA